MYRANDNCFPANVQFAGVPAGSQLRVLYRSMVASISSKWESMHGGFTVHERVQPIGVCLAYYLR